jgi:hypothetical protein
MNSLGHRTHFHSLLTIEYGLMDGQNLFHCGRPVPDVREISFGDGIEMNEFFMSRGNGIEMNKSLAAHYFKLSANGGEVQAQFNSGVMLFDSDGIEMNKSLAACYFKHVP